MALFTTLALVSALAVQAPVRPRFVVLAIGISGYKNVMQTGFGPLNGPNDVSAFVKALETYYGLSAAKGDLVKMLTADTETTKARIEEGLNWLATVAKKDDAVVFFYSGHGTRVPDATKATGYSQAIVPIDVKRVGDKAGNEIDAKTVIPGPRFRVLLNGLQQKGCENVTMIFDSCHSESISRGSLISKAGIPNPAPPAAFNGTGTPGKGWEIQGALAIISAAQADREAYENAQTKQGILTTAIVETMAQVSKSGVGSMSYDRFFSRVQSLAQYYANALSQTQIPTFEGNRSRKLFGAETVPVPATYKLFVEGAVLKLRAGMIHGVREGDVFGIYKGESVEGKPEFYAKARVPIDVDTAALTVVDANDKPVAVGKHFGAYQAKLVSGQPSGKVRVFVDSTDTKWVSQIHALPTAAPGTPDRHDLRLMPARAIPRSESPGVPQSAAWVLRDARGNVVYATPTDDPTALLSEIRPEIIKETKRRAVADIRPSGPSAVPIEMELVQVKVRRDQEGNETAIEIVRPNEPGASEGKATLALSTQFGLEVLDQRFALRVRVVNPAKATYAPVLCVLDVTANGKVMQLWPNLDSNQSFTGNVDRIRVPKDGQWHYLGHQNDLVKSTDLGLIQPFFVNSAEDGAGVETLKAIATERYQDFSVLFAERSRGEAKGERNALSDLLQSIGDASPLPFTSRAGSNTSVPVNWSVAEVRLLVDVKQ